MRYKFADCLLDIDGHHFLRAGHEVSLEPQVFDLLHLLAENAGKLVSKDQMIEVVWNGRIVSEATVSARINAARTAVGDNGQDQAIIRTVPRRGIELIAPVEVADDTAQVSAQTNERQKIRYTQSADGTQIAFATSGSGPPLLRASHHLSHLELDWNSPFWRPMFARLNGSYNVVRYDIRGAGLSDRNAQNRGIDYHVADMKAVADAAGLDCFPLLTTLQNTPVAIRFVAQNPDRVSRLVIHEGYVRGRGLRSGAPADQDADPIISLARDGWGQPDNGYMRAWVSMVMPGASYDEVTDMILLLSSATSADEIIEARKAIDLFTAEGFLDKVKVPTLVIHARNDTIHPLAEGRELAAGIPGAEFLVVESGGTLCIPSDPTWGEQMDAIMGFLGEG